MTGNRLGPKSDYLYTDDTGKQYTITVDDNLATAAGLAGAITPDPGAPPKRSKLRGVYVQSDTAPIIRKFVICGSVTAALYANNGSQAVTIDGETFTTTGRKGEQFSF